MAEKYGITTSGMEKADLAAAVEAHTRLFRPLGAVGFQHARPALAAGCGVVGGDLSASPAHAIAVTAFGDLEGRAPVRRSGARPGDVLAVGNVEQCFRFTGESPQHCVHQSARPW